jgi:hypothetical protein
MAQRLNWDKANKQRRARTPTSIETIPMIPDAAFWRIWKADKDAMKASGYRVRKIDGQFRVFLRSFNCRPSKN